ncbi:S-layer homology domain-containing protein, partial [Clostridiaceae bacterium HSG29]|nr:S-layer homology domain-containing protein [Clostridiaceae bacterium HSG29]
MNFKKTFSLIIISTLFISSVSFAAPAEWAKSSYYSVKYEKIIDSGMVVDRLFQKNITREEFIEMLVKVYLDEKNINIESVGSDDYFSDTSNTYIEYAYKLGIVKGVGDNRFLPFKNVTRQEMAVMMKNILDKLSLTNNNYNNSTFSDRYDVSSWAVNAIDYCYYNNLINGMGNNM